MGRKRYPHVCLWREFSGPRRMGLIQIKGPPAASAVTSGRSTRDIPEVGKMAAKIDDLIPSAKQIQKEAALKEAQKAEEHAKKKAAADAEKQKLIDKLSKPSGLSEDEKVKLAANVIQRAVRNGLTEVEVYRFPNSLCTDRGRAINQMEKGCSHAATAFATRSSISPAACPAISASPSVGTIDRPRPAADQARGPRRPRGRLPRPSALGRKGPCHRFHG
jgi:hypothetical protein